VDGFREEAAQPDFRHQLGELSDIVARFADPQRGKTRGRL